eukprot:jgi/Picre1/34078/NNA_001553.t1
MAQRVSLSSGPKGHIGAFNSVKGSTRVNLHSTRFSPTVHRALSVDSIAELGKEIRQEFPVLDQEVHGKRLVYLDNAATSQKPDSVISTMTEYYREYNSNVHRGVHALSARATTEYEKCQAKGGSNIVPWQLLAERRGVVLKFVPLDTNQRLDMNVLEELVGPRTRLISLVHMSNALGCHLPVDKVVEMAKRVGSKVLLDACQSVANIPIDVQRLGVDWIVGSAHKLCGPTGIGFLWGTTEALESMPPWMGGGEMIDVVTLEKTTFAAPPSRFEAGTPAIAEAIGFGAACDFLQNIGMDNVEAYEKHLGMYLHSKLQNIKGLTVYGPSYDADQGRSALATFNVEGIHPTDLSTILDQNGIAVRSGHLCTQPLHQSLGVAASIRASPYIYNTLEDVDCFVQSLEETIAFFREMGIIGLDLEKPAWAADDFTETASGLRFYDIKEGSGKLPKEGSTCVIHWAGYTEGYQGKRFGNSSLKDEPYEFRLGRKEAIPAIEEAVSGMKVGGLGGFRL